MIYLDENRSLTLQGVSQLRAEINNLQKKLVQSPMFENVNLEYSTKRRAFRGVELTDFKITCTVARKEK